VRALQIFKLARLYFFYIASGITIAGDTIHFCVCALSFLSDMPAQHGQHHPAARSAARRFFPVFAGFFIAGIAVAVVAAFAAAAIAAAAAAIAAASIAAASIAAALAASSFASAVAAAAITATTVPTALAP